ncbi:glycosyltransferase [Phycicoccus duodecadis]|uniref:Glycosyltransferase involved in cell wall biosynthesis n=1 Tax=Phycicoccus duodecadis TaxID=173053 RepID=A0A2N3YI91_9MICO|nr:glycosyltransferase [Phycicoccus duodecadis]PKW26560.1 glycosyltransferase involved in cell wall biosynthesis [Phycicoccus duodecadis]
MHIVILAAARHPIAEPFAGGLESLTWHLVHGLRGRGVDVTVFAGEGSDPALDARMLGTSPLRLSDAARADVSMVPESWLREHHAYLQVMLHLQRRDDVDVVHNNSLHHLPVAMAGSVPSAVLTTLHTPPTPWLEPAIAIARSVPGAGLHHVAVSEHTAAAWRHVTEVDVVPNGVDVRRWTPGPGGPDLAWAGRIVPEKAPHLAIAAARAAGRRLRLAGPVGDPAYFASHVAPLLGPDAEYVGHLGTAGLAALFGSSAVTLVTPAWEEPYGLVAAESLACGTPVVAIARGGLPEVLDAATGVLVDPDPDAPDDDALVAGLAAAVGAAGLLDRGACRDRAVRECSVDRMVSEYLAHYEVLTPGLVA